MTISGRTELLGILGDPIENARSPEHVNKALEARGYDAVLLPLHVRSGALPGVLDGLRNLENFRGAVVTMPHKESIAPLLDDVSAESRLLGACNVVRREAGGRLCGAMLDGEGFVAGLRGAGHEVRDRQVLLAGAGGAASGIAYALCKYGARKLVIHNRTRARAEVLAARVGDAWPATEISLGDSIPAECDIVINATSLGMREGDPLPVDPDGLAPRMLAADVVIRHEATPFLAEAGKRGCAVHPGISMLENQIDLLIDFMLPA